MTVAALATRVTSIVQTILLAVPLALVGIGLERVGRGTGRGSLRSVGALLLVVAVVGPLVLSLSSPDPAVTVSPTSPSRSGAARAELRASMGGGQLQVGSGAAGLYELRAARPRPAQRPGHHRRRPGRARPALAGPAGGAGPQPRQRLAGPAQHLAGLAAGRLGRGGHRRPRPARARRAPPHLPVGPLPPGRPPRRPGRRGPGRPPALGRPGRPVPAEDGHGRDPGRRPQRRQLRRRGPEPRRRRLAGRGQRHRPLPDPRPRLRGPPAPPPRLIRLSRRRRWRPGGRCGARPGRPRRTAPASPGPGTGRRSRSSPAPPCPRGTGGS